MAMVVDRHSCQHDGQNNTRKKNLGGGQLFWTRHELAEQLGVSVDWVDRQVAARRIPFIKPSRKVIRFPVVAMRIWMEQQMIIPSNMQHLPLEDMVPQPGTHQAEKL